jgi:hypothetical protein
MLISFIFGICLVVFVVIALIIFAWYAIITLLDFFFDAWFIVVILAVIGCVSIASIII